MDVSRLKLRFSQKCYGFQDVVFAFVYLLKPPHPFRLLYGFKTRQRNACYNRQFIVCVHPYAAKRIIVVCTAVLKLQ